MDALAARIVSGADTGVATALKAVIAGMDSPGQDRFPPVDPLTSALTRAVPAFLGFTITVQTGLRAVTMTTAAPLVGQTAGACLLLLLAPGVEPGSSAVLYAREPGAFDQLATSDEWRSCSYDPVILDPYLQRL